MITPVRLLYFAILYGLLTTFSPASSGAPYLFTPGNDDGTECFPLKHSTAKITIDGAIARGRLSQTFGNAGSTPVEAVYVFPASTRAAVHGMKITSGGRTTAARIRKKDEARTEYETAKRENKTAALLEEQRENVFQMSVAHLLPGDDIVVDIEWTETIPSVEGVNEFVFPTVVGPRYTGGEGDATSWTANPHLAAGTSNPATFDLAVDLATALPLSEVSCPSHPAAVDFQSERGARIRLETTQGDDAANRDFVLKWKLGGEQVDAGLLLHHGEDASHFLLQVEPPARVTSDKIPPRDYVMILDVSGSMSGFPLDTAKRLLHELVGNLKPTDTFNVLCFSGGTGLLSETPLPANEENLEAATRFIDEQSAGGATELGAAMQRAIALPGGEDRSRSLLLVTDGYVSADEQTCTLVRRNIGRANVFAFGIGSSVNRALIEGISRAGGGEASIVTRPSEAEPVAHGFLDKISSPVLAKVRIEADGVEIADLEPDPHPDVFRSRPLLVMGRWDGRGEGAVVVRGIAGNGKPFEKRISFAEAAKNGTDHPALPVLWARERVRRLQDGGGAEAKAEITRLGLTYSLLTRHTSFIAVDETPRPVGGLAKTVRQPLPLPQGVTETALGSSGGPIVANGSVPEPAMLGLISVLVILLALQRGR